MELHQLAESVSDEKSFLAFVDALRRDRELAASAENASLADRYGPERGWENVTIESFLEAAHAWAEDTDFGARQDLREASPWRKFAIFLYCGKIYE
ncbi:MAG TPA: hypothetical protein VFS41_06025 [Edaphobacter sp.]|nr:hypothetical protein [Edaphobacter sp.]HVX90756.1 hypothetical protein [Candidatus Paceibacterota bacterium]